MKNTRKILMIFCSIAVLLATVFAVVTTAVVAGEGTTVNEYANMKITASHGFEDGLHKVLFGNIANGSVSANGGIYIENNGIRQAADPIYGDETSIRYFVIDYDTNKSSADLYIQPKLGVLDDVEKTPVNGFVAEFDISFMTPVEVLTQQKVDENGELVWEVEATDAEGNPIYKFDENGEKIPVMENVQEPLLTDEIKRDENGDIVYKAEWVQDTNEDGSLKWEEDSDGNQIAVMKPIYILDENGEKIPEYVEMTDENGELIMVDKVVAKEWKGLSTTFGIGMYNTHTYKDGKVDLLTFETDKANKRMKLAKISGNLLENAPSYSVAADEWCHITVQYDAKSLLTYVYVGRDDSEFDTNGDGETDVYGRLLLAIKRTTYVLETGETTNVYPLQFRLGCKSTSGVVAFDNFIGYQGTTIHDPTLLNNKLPYEKYLYLADILGNETEYETVKDSEGNVVYQTVTDESGNVVNVLDSFGNKVPEFKLDANGKKIVVKKGAKFVDRYQAFNLLATSEELRKVYTQEDLGGEPDFEEQAALERAYELYNVYANDKKNNTGSTETLYSCYYEMLNNAKKENAATYLSYAYDVLNTERTLENHADRSAKILKAEEFYNSVGSLIERDANGDYGEATAILERMSAFAKGDAAADSFVKAMAIFNNSVAYGATASRIKTHYDNATFYYSDISTDYDSEDTTLVEDSAKKLRDAVASYIASASIVSDNVKAANSVRFAGLVNMMLKKSTGSWAQDGEEVEALWLRALDILLDENYDADMEEFAVAKVMFDTANEHFWNKMQKDHIKVISDKLDSYNDPDMTYIDKAGICTYVERYIEANARYLDLESIEITRELSRNEAYKLQLNTLVGDYKKLLVENAPRFISVMKMSKHYSTYADLKPLYDEATKYYYTMNIEGEGIEECLADYEELRALITSIEKDSGAYIDIIYGNITDEEGNAIFKPLSEITNKQELYASLKEAYLCFENLDMTYPGAAEAKAIYDAKYQEYNTSATQVNTELACGESVVYAARGNWTFDTVVIFVKKLINVK